MILAREKDNVYYYSNEVYKLPKNQINGFFLFTSEADATTHAVFHKTTSRSSSFSSVDRGHFGCSKVVLPYSYIRCENGSAIYYGNEHFNLYDALNLANLKCGDFCQDGMVILENAICTIRVLQRKRDPIIFHGDSIIKVFDQFVFYVNNRAYWGGFAEYLSYKNYNNVIFSIYDNASEKEYTFGKDGVRMSSMLSDDGQPFTMTRIGKNDFFIIELPKEIEPNQISISWLQPSSATVRFYPVFQSVEEIYSEEYKRLSEILLIFKNLGLELNIQKELTHLNNAPDFIVCCLDFLSEKLSKRNYFLQKNLDKNKRLTFHVGASYDKKYYCAVKLAESAFEILKDENRSVYYITFDGTQIDEIELMYFNLASPFNSGKDYMVDIKNYLSDSSFFSHLQATIDSYVGNLREQYGYSGVVTK